MLNKKLLGGLVAACFTISTFAIMPLKTTATARLIDGSKIEFDSKGTVDLSMANEERLIKMLKKEGKIAPNATQEEELAALQSYLKTMEKDYVNDPSKLTKEEKMFLDKIKKEINPNGVKNNNKFPGTTPRTWDGKVKKDKILVLLEDFQDYKHGQISPDETDMYYKDYTVEHYQNMLFGDKGYVTPIGETVMSMKQYYEQQSGGSYTVEGKVLGWYTASNTAAYYGADSATSRNIRAKTFVFEALKAAAKNAGVDLNEYDLEDPYDVDGDGNVDEPDGIIDHLMTIHAGVGQEAGGGVLGDNAIWSHSSKLSTGPVGIPGTSSQNSLAGPGGPLAAWAYTIMPEDGASGVFCHEFGHDLGLPDEYDTVYSGKGEPVSAWSLMANGSWAGTVPGTEPSGFSPYGKLLFQQFYGGNWMHGSEIDLKDVSKSGLKYVLDQAAIKGKNNDYVKINLPDKAHQVLKPFEGKYVYFGGTGKDGTPIKKSMTTNIDLTGKTSAKLTFKTMYDIEEGWDFASIQVREKGTETWTALPGNITTTEKVPGAVVNVANGITGTSNGWVDGIFDLSSFAGKNIELKFEYETDTYTFGAGFFVDNIDVTAGSSIFTDGAEEATKFTLNGFTQFDGIAFAPHYYILEWRNHVGTDIGLAHINKLGNIMSYDPGLVIWYADDFYSDNWVGAHPGEGYLGVVDADQRLIMWQPTDGTAPFVASTQYQIHDAAFSQRQTQPELVDFTPVYPRTFSDKDVQPIHMFSDSNSYISPLIPDAGKNLPIYGLNITVTGEKNDRSQATIMIKVK